MTGPTRPVPAGFNPPRQVEEREVIPTVNREDMKDGVVVKFIKRDAWSAKGEDFAMYHLESISKGRKFGVWATAQLDVLTKGIQPGAVMFVRYDGKGPHPTDPKKTVHNWTVALQEGTQVFGTESIATDKDDLPF